MGKQKTTAPSSNKTTYIHIAVGLSFMFLFPQLPPMEPITKMGMWVLGIFISMIYLWSAVGSTWPSILGLTVIGVIGFAGPGYKGLASVIQSAYGLDSLIIVLFSMVLFGALEFYGCSQYIARWFLSRRIINGRPYAFMGIFYVCCYVLAALTSPVSALFVMWAIAVDMLSLLDINKSDRLYPVFIMGSFWATCVGQATLPFKGAPMVILSTFEKFSGQSVNSASYILFVLIMACFMLPAYLLLTKFIFRPDVTKLKNITVERVNEKPLPPMNFRQKAFLCMMIPYGVMILLPNIISGDNPIIRFLSSLGTLGVNSLVIVVMCILHAPDGKPLLQFREVAAKTVSWDVFFIVAAAVYIANALSAEVTGINPWIIKVLTPILEGTSEWMFVFLIFGITLLLTNFANNVAMAIIMMPIIIAFCSQRGIPSMPLAVGTGLMVFMAILTPSAAPHAGMMHARKDLISTKDIFYLGGICCGTGLLIYSVVGYPLLKLIIK